MLKVILQTCNEPKVLELTKENIGKELRSVRDSELVVSDGWWGDIPDSDYVCYIECDCLVSSGYFSSMLGLFLKNPHYRKLAMLCPSTGINYWHDRVFGYFVGREWSDDTNKIRTKNKHLYPIKDKKSTSPYPLQVGYLPGSIIRTSALKDIMKTSIQADNMNELSCKISLAFWDTGRRVHLNPNSTYVTTNLAAGEKSKFDPQLTAKTYNIFKKESI
jgi:hypothetical protein